jgi:hypothetical protein
MAWVESVPMICTSVMPAVPPGCNNWNKIFEVNETDLNKIFEVNETVTAKINRTKTNMTFHFLLEGIFDISSYLYNNIR